MKRIFFTDFDGTITRTDTCAAMVEAFAGEGWQEINEMWERKELSTEECANRIFQLFRAGLDDIRRLVENIEVDSSFKDFLAFCRGRCYRVYVLSDGYDFNIEVIFKKYEIDVPYYANRLVYNSRFRIRCPYSNQICGNCGTCKKRLMEELKKPGEQVVYIGDGYSDTCPAAHADLVFAKGTLYAYCREKGIPVMPFDNFRDIIEVVKKLESCG
jgi:2-hydroxy-3-keto-5-methylthiopentenyl-1-phosphate phosphatase